MEEFNLSEKVIYMRTLDKKLGGNVFLERDVKEFIKKIKELLDDCRDSSLNEDIIDEKFNKLVGEKLK